MEVQYLRQQRDQFTALENIYLDEFQVVKETAPYKFNVLCKPYKGNQLEYQINLMFEFTNKYPLTPLHYEIEPIAGITRDNINHIHKKIEDILLDNQHRPVVFDIVEETRNWIHQYLVDGRSYHQEEEEVVAKEQIYERPKFAAFTPVTVQNFLAWKRDFDARHRVDKDKNKKETEMKVTGKQWFLGVHEGEIVEDSEDEDEDSDSDIDEAQPQNIPQPQNELFQN